MGDQACRDRPVACRGLSEAQWQAEGLSLDRALAASVMIGVPCYRDVMPEHYAAGVETVALFLSLGIGCELKIVKNAPVHQARNSIANRFLESEHTDLLFVDDDMSWKPWDAVRLLASPHPLIAAIGRKKIELPDTDMTAWCWSQIGPVLRIDRAGAIEVGGVGTGMMKIHRSVLETMATAHPEWRRRARIADTAAQQRYYVKFFGWNDQGEDEISEDLGFCNAWRALGGAVWADPTIEMQHYGVKAFGGSLARFIERAP